MDSLFLLGTNYSPFLEDDVCFNPCFNGFTILTLSYRYGKLKDGGFNPCFNGFTILTRTFEKTPYLSMLQEFFQILKSHFFD